MDAYVAGQRLRKKAKLLEAEEQLVACGQPACHRAMRDDCIKWLKGVRARIPSLVVALSDESGADVVEAKLYIDGILVKERLDGRAIALNPGPRRLKLVFDGGDPIEREVVVRESEQGRLVRLGVEPEDSGASAPLPTTPPAGGAPSAATAPSADAVDDEPVAAYVLGSVSLVAFGLFAGLGISGTDAADELHDTCGVTASCTEEQVDEVRARLIAADISLAVGVVSFGVGLGLFLHNKLASGNDRQRAAARRLYFGVAPTAGGAFGQMGGRF